MKDKLYLYLYLVWQWYALKILRVPFIVTYTPPPGETIEAVTFSWSLEYSQKIQSNWDAHKRYEALLDAYKKQSHELNVALDQIDQLERQK